MPLSTATSATLAAGSTPRDGMPAVDEVLEQVTVVARELHDEAASSRPKRWITISRSARACSTQLSEYDEKYGYAEKITSGATYSSSWTRKHSSHTQTCSG